LSYCRKKLSVACGLKRHLSISSVLIFDSSVEE
jgi:hypothetical protein